jgi:hypothetical protein
MDVPTSIAGLLVLLLAVLPGIPGDHLYRAIAGVSWREKDATRILRLLTFSVLGLVVYSLIADRTGWPLPEYIVPATFLAPTFNGRTIAALSLAYLGHFLSSTAVGLASVGGNAIIGRIRSVSASRDAWEHFVRCAVPCHWVVVTLENGEIYAGILDHADVSTEPEYRDLVLAEPYRYDEANSTYAPTYHQYLFIRGSSLSSIAAVHDPSNDNRIVPVTESPFEENPRATSEVSTASGAKANSTPADQGGRET